MRSPDTTIKDISRIAGVSYSTVSRALNKKPGVSEVTRQRIFEIAKQLGYRPNAIARNLVQRQTKTIGLIIPQLTNPFYPAVAEGVEDAADARGYSVLLCNSKWDPEKQSKYLNLLVERRVDGIILAAMGGDFDEIEEIVGDIPLVYIGSAPESTPRHGVIMNNEHGGFLAGTHLLEEGYSPLAFIGTAMGSLTLEARLNGFRRALRAKGIELEDEYIEVGDSRELKGEALLKRLMNLKKPPKAVFVENDLLAMGVMTGAGQLGLKVPQDLAVVGFDDIPFSSLPEIQLSTVYHPKEKMGAIAADRLIQEIEFGPDGTVGEKIILDPDFIHRATS
jgi:LacI family transcriptional regulator